MYRRFAAVMLLLVVAGEAQAHRLEAQIFVRPFGFIQVESWYETGDIPKAAKVEVFGPGGEKLTEGRIDDKGAFVFSYTGTGPLRVVVNAGAGHLATEHVKPADLVRAAEGTRAICTWVACATPSPAPLVATPLLVEIRAAPSLEPITSRDTGPQYGKLLLGVGILLAVALGALGLRRLRGIRRAPGSSPAPDPADRSAKSPRPR
jgi:hypothetical protein